jgi:hypothetical protein
LRLLVLLMVVLLIRVLLGLRCVIVIVLFSSIFSFLKNNTKFVQNILVLSFKPFNLLLIIFILNIIKFYIIIQFLQLFKCNSLF